MSANRKIDKVEANHVAAAKRCMVHVRFSEKSTGWIQVSKVAMFDALKYVTDEVEGELDRKLVLWIGLDH